MITLPPEFTATKYSGYFWNVNEQALYSIKIGGRLRRLTITEPNNWSQMPGPGYRISVDGVRKVLMVDDLKKLSITDSVIPIAEDTES